MGKAGQALRQVLEDYEISQTQLAEALGLGRSNVNRWVTETRDPTAEVRESAGMKVKELARAVELAEENRGLILRVWHEHHG